MSSWGKIFVIHSNIRSEPAGVDQGFLRGDDLYLRAAELMETCPQSVACCNLEPTAVHVNIENYYTRNTSSATK